MNSPVENILQHLFQTDSLQNVSVEQIQQLINEQPYYDAAYLLLAKKLHSTNDSNYEKAVQRAALHFSNELWLHYNLNEESIVEEKIEQPQQQLIIEQQTTLVSEPEVEKPEEKIIEESLPVETLLQKEIEPTNAENEEDVDEEEIDNIDENYTEADFPVNEKLSNILKEQAAALEKPVESSTEIPIENTPYHRIDYFDSQGIKLEEGKTDDKLGTQLKRFTDWLKQMKRINTNQVDLGNDEAGEKQVENIAQHSNKPEEIVTETMAEVLVKQGKPEQAIQIYEKLSFNNPSKSAYFAAKIAELKG